MALDQDMAQAPQTDRLSDDEEQDLKIAVNIGKNLIDDGGHQVIDQAMTSKDPGIIIGQFILQLGSQLFEQMPEDQQLSTTVLLAKGGWVEQISDYLQDQYDVPKETMDRAEMYVGAQAASMAQGQQQGQAAQPAPAAIPQPAGGIG